MHAARITVAAALGAIIRAMPIEDASLTARSVCNTPGKTDYTTSEIRDCYMLPHWQVYFDNHQCVFYYGLFRDQAIDWAGQSYNQNKVTLYDVYQSSAFDNNADPQRSYAAANNGDPRPWFEVTSKAYAEVCKDICYFVYDGVQDCSTARPQGKAIWLTDELPAIQSSGLMNQVIVVNPANYQQEVFYPNWQTASTDQCPMPITFAPTFTAGICHVHVLQYQSRIPAFEGPQVFVSNAIRAYLYDGAGTFLNYLDNSLEYQPGHVFSMAGVPGVYLQIIPGLDQTTITFKSGDKYWDNTAQQGDPNYCGIGGWAQIDSYYFVRTMDCYYLCP